MSRNASDRSPNYANASYKSPGYFLWMILQVVVWLVTMGAYVDELGEAYWRLLGLAGYFLAFFIVPLFAERLKWMTIAFCAGAFFAFLTVYPLQDGTLNPYILLIVAMLTAEIAHRLPLTYGIYPTIMQVIGLSLFIVKGSLSLEMQLFIALYMVLLISAAVIYHLKHESDRSMRSRYDALFTEFRRLKRRSGTDEQIARQEERALIGHEIHDSVGHKLTALIMQLESYRLQSGQEEQVAPLKKLAEESLAETRRAVQTLGKGEVGGLQGVIRLIRKLESDSFLRVRFTVDHGAFNAPLNGEQSFVIYRSVQEALTNIMKHSKAREAKVVFEVPGGSVFRFEVSNPLAKGKDNTSFKEGYGLTSMRERLQKINGDLDVYATADQFVVRGWLRLMNPRGIHQTGVDT